MLHEILLSLSGHPSNVLAKAKSDAASPEKDGNIAFLSPPERALLATLSDISELHIQVRRHVSAVAKSHESIICRAVATHLISHILREFQQKILEVERNVLAKDSAYVGGYGIVPLSSIVTEFAPWQRRLQWLWKIAVYMQPADRTTSRDYCSGPSLITFLRAESYTGYEDLERLALGLLKTAESAWLRLLSSWLLYGNLPSVGSNDIFIGQIVGVDNNGEFILRSKLIPSFVSPLTADAVLFIGRSLIQIRTQRFPKGKGQRPLGINTSNSLLPVHLALLESLRSPYNVSDVTSVIAKIKMSLSQNALAYLLPKTIVLQAVGIIGRFLLLQQGEFAVSLIGQADRRIQERVKDQPQHVRKAGLLDHLNIKEGEITSVLNQTWAEIAALQENEDSIDDELEKARDLIVLKNEPLRSLARSDLPTFDDLLFPTETILSLRIEAPLDLFLTSADLRSYSAITSLLLGIRRAELHLSSLWKNGSLRRCQPTPAGPPFSSSSYGLGKLEERRQRENRRQRKLRPVWAIARAALFLTTELGAYLQGFVVQNHFNTFYSWLSAASSPAIIPESSRPPSASEAADVSFGNNDIPTADSPSKPILDPATLTSAHRLYLRSLRHSMFLHSTGISRPLRDFLLALEHFIALFGRLSTIHSSMDLEAEGVEIADPTRSLANDEKDIFDEMQRTRTRLKDLMQTFVSAVRAWEGETEQHLDDEADNLDDIRNKYGGFRPWDWEHGGPSSGVEALIMRLDFLDPQVLPVDQDRDFSDGY